MEEKFQKRFAMWKRQFISKGERITLIHNTLSSMSIYLMSLLCILRVVRLRLEQIQLDFLLGGSFGEEASSCKVGYRLFGQKEEWFGS